MPKIGTLSTFFKFDLLLTSTHLWWNLFFVVKMPYPMLVNAIIWVCMQKLCPWVLFKENYLFLILIDLEWPLRNAHVKLEWLMYVRDIIWVFIPKIVTYGDLKWLLGSKCYFLCGSGTSYENVCWKFGPWVHFSKLSILTSSDLWGFLG